MSRVTLTITKECKGIHLPCGSVDREREREGEKDKKYNKYLVLGMWVHILGLTAWTLPAALAAFFQASEASEATGSNASIQQASRTAFPT